MTVFKACLKIIKKNAGILCIYIFVAVFMSVAFIQSDSGTPDSQFEYSDVKVSVINHDAGNALADGLKDYLAGRVTETEIKEDSVGMRDALLYRAVEYILIIPENYTNDYAAGKKPVLEKMEVMGSYSGTYVNSMIESFLGTVDVYMASVPGISIDEAVNKTNELYGKSIDVSVESEEASEHTHPAAGFFYFSIYSILATVVIGTGLIVTTFNKDDLKKRNLVSPVSSVKMNFIQTMGNMVFGLIIWVVLEGAAIIIYGESMFEKAGIFMSVNMFIAVIMALAIGFLVSTFAKTENSINAFANTFALGCSFIGGVFVPMEMMGSAVEKIAVVTPTYWYIKAIDRILQVPFEISSFNIWSSMKGVYGAMAAELLIAVIAFTIGTVRVKLKRRI